MSPRFYFAMTMGWAYGKEIPRSWGGAQGAPLALNSDPSVEPHSPATIVGCDWLSSPVWLRVGALGLGGWRILGLLCHSIMFLWPLESERSVSECETPPRRPDCTRRRGHSSHPVPCRGVLAPRQLPQFLPFLACHQLCNPL